MADKPSSPSPMQQFYPGMPLSQDQMTAAATNNQVGNYPTLTPSSGKNPTPYMSLLQQGTVQSADEFQKNLPGLKQQYRTMAEDTSRQALSSKLASIRTGANQRGLLNSGMRQGAEAGAAAQNLNQLSNTEAGINTNLEALSDAVRQGSIQSGAALQSLQQQALNIAYQQSVMSQQQTQQNISSGVGAGIGLLGLLALA